MKIRKLTAADLKLGMLIPWNVYGDNGTLLVRKGHMIASANQIDSLVERGSFEDDSEQAAEARAPESVLRKLNAAALELPIALAAIASGTVGGPGAADIRRKLEDIALLVAGAVELNADIAVAAILHNQQAGPYAVRHCIDSAVVVQILARALKKSPGEIASLTMAALTMNVGMLEHQDRLQDSRAPLGDADRAVLRGHPERGVALLRHVGIVDSDWLDAVLYHHENEDGSGYPQARSGAAIPATAKLLALADRYCARVSNRGYRKPMLPNAALREILLEAKVTLDGQLAGVLIRELGIYPIGTCVRLVNGEVAVVSRKGLQSTTPYVESIIGPRGAPLEVFLQRDTRGDLSGIREVLPTAQSLAEQRPLRMEQIWGRAAAV